MKQAKGIMLYPFVSNYEVHNKILPNPKAKAVVSLLLLHLSS